MAVTIVTDSTCDLYNDVTKQKGIIVMPLRVHLGTKTYRDGVDISVRDIYTYLKEHDDMPGTSQPSIQEFLDLYQSIEGEILSIHIASTLSGTANVAEQAKRMMGADGERVHVYDSQTLSLAQGLLVLAAKEQADLGKSVEEITAHLDNIYGHLRIWFSVADLNHLYRGGRIGKAQATIGGLLRVKPILTFDHGVITNQDKAFGDIQVINKLLDRVEKDHALNPIKRIFVANGNKPEYMDELEKRLRERIVGDYEILHGEIGSVIAVHAGLGSLGVMYY